RAWLHIAVRREAMVKSVYDEANRMQRLPTPRVPAGEVAWEALTLIWQQEAVHTTFVETRLKDGLLRDRAWSTDLDLWQGTLEGKFLTALTSRAGLRQILSKLAVQFGARFVPNAVPEFVRELSELGLREFFLLCSALEATARQSYARMEALAASVAERLARDVPSLQLRSLTQELQRVTLDETFHEAAFQEMAGWVVNGQINPALVDRTCAKRLLDLLPVPENRNRNAPVWQVLTDGGLGKLFRKHNLAFEISEHFLHQRLALR
ncbi:MAG TPA: hypothetical protein VLM79_13500, partial [Kofleriaceae bacterium]|nr:hypothetical protein [Kofleriaceae bacterium]